MTATVSIHATRATADYALDHLVQTVIAAKNGFGDQIPVCREEAAQWAVIYLAASRALGDPTPWGHS